MPEIDLGQIRQVVEGPYRILYHIKPEQIDVLAFVHETREILSGR